MYKRAILFTMMGLGAGVLATMGFTGSAIVLINAVLFLMIETRRGYSLIK